MILEVKLTVLRKLARSEDVVVRNMLVNSDLSVEELSRISGVSLDKVVDLKNKL